MKNMKMRNSLLFTASVDVILTATVLGRLVWAYRQVGKAETGPLTISVARLGSTGSLSVLPLFEEWSSSNEFQSGHGVSYLIKTDHHSVLMDLGNNEQNLDSAPLLHNMDKLAVAMDGIDALVISHNHPDHVGGIANWKRSVFSTGGQQANLAGMKTYLPAKMACPGIDAELALEPTVIAPGVATLGRQPFVQPFPFCLWNPLGWEQSLVVNVEGKGLVVVMGCGHPSMEGIVRRAEAVFPQPVVGVVGGLHYEKAEEEALTPHIDFLALRNPDLVALSPHDSSGDVLQAFEAAFPKAYRYISIGVAIEMP